MVRTRVPGTRYRRASPIVVPIKRLSSATSIISPDSISDMWGWWKPESLVGYSDGDNITGWPDSGPNSLDLNIQNTPTYQENECNGYAAVQFQGTESCYIDSATTATEMTIFSVAKLDAPIPGLAIWIGAVTDGAVAARGFGISVSDVPGTIKVRIAEGTPVDAVDNTITLGNYQLYTARHATNLTECWLDGTSKTLTNSTVNYTACQVADYTFIGSGGGHPTHEVVEVIIYERDLTNAELSNVHSYLNSKYSLF